MDCGWQGAVGERCFITAVVGTNVKLHSVKFMSSLSLSVETGAGEVACTVVRLAAGDVGLRSRAPAARSDGGRDWEENSFVLNVQLLERTWLWCSAGGTRCLLRCRRLVYTTDDLNVKN